MGVLERGKVQETDREPGGTLKQDGNQFLILFLALVTGAGILFGYLLIRKIRFGIFQPTLASILSVSVGYLLILINN